MNDNTGDLPLETTQTLDVLLHQVLNHALVLVGAEGGSLMLVDDRRGILQIKARLGPPRPGRKAETVYKTTDNSIAAWVVREKRSYMCPDVTSDDHFAPSPSGVNFRSLLSVPIIYQDRVVAVINADSSKETHFSDRDQEALQGFAAKVAEPTATRISILDAVAQAGLELARSPRDGGVEPVLQRIAELAVRSLGADIVTLYQYIDEKKEFAVEGTGPTIAGDLWDPQPMLSKVFKGDVPWSTVHENGSGFYANVREYPILTGPVNREGVAPRKRFVDREKIESMAALLLLAHSPGETEQKLVGVMFTNYRRRHDFNIDEISALNTFANFAAAAIHNARLEVERRSNQLKLVESISANLAHRMNQFVGASRAAAQLLREIVPANDDVRIRYLDIIEHKAALLFRLVEKLKEPFETGRYAKLDVFDVSPVIAAILDTVRKATGGRIEILDAIEPDLPKVKSVTFQLEQVLHDVIDNAVEAMAGAPFPRLGVRAQYKPSTQRVEIRISDNGLGIEEKVRNRLFTPGGSTKTGRMGIGLWWCKAFMESTDGNLRLERSEADFGSTFVIEVPCVTPEEKREREPVPLGPTSDVLIVEDEEDFRLVLRAGIDRRFAIKDVGSYEAARKALLDERFKVAVLDVSLVEADPDNVDGLKLLDDMDVAGARTKVLIVTGYSTNDRTQAARSNARVIGIIPKGHLNMIEYRDIIRRAVQDSDQG